MKYIDDSFLQSDEKVIKFFGKAGVVLSDSEVHKLPSYAKYVQHKDGKTNYYISVYQSSPFDPMGPYARRERNIDTKMQRVSKNTFDFYITYLITNNTIYLTKARRSMLND